MKICDILAALCGALGLIAAKNGSSIRMEEVVLNLGFFSTSSQFIFFLVAEAHQQTNFMIYSRMT